MNFEDLPLEDILRKQKIAESIGKEQTNLNKLKDVNLQNNLKNDTSKKFSKIYSKNLPLEVSSRKPSLPEKLENERNYIRNKHENIKKNDPRFNDSCGKLNIDLFQKSYEFIDKIRNQEFNEIKNTLDLYKAMNKSKQLGTWNKDKKSAKFKNSGINQLTEEDISELKLKYQKLTSEINHRRNIFLKQKAISTHRKQEQLKVQQGKKPFFLKQKEINLAVKHEKYKNLKNEGKIKLEKRLSKKQMSKFKPPKNHRNIN